MRNFRLSLSLYLAAFIAGAHPQAAGPRAAATATIPRLLSIRAMLHENALQNEQLMLRGTVTHVSDPIVIQDETGAVTVRTGTPMHFMLGDEAEVRGVRVVQSGTTVIESSQIRTLWQSSPPAPLALTPDRAAEGEYDSYLVEVEGTVVRQDGLGNGSALMFAEGEHQLFSAAAPGTGQDFVPPAPGSLVRWTGVLAVRKTRFGLQSGSFTILLRAPEDVRVVKGPPWWSPVHVLLLFVLILALAAVLHWVRLEAIKRRFAAVAEERARIARDIHDTLAQGFAGIAFQMEGASQEMEHNPSTARNYLDLALSMVRHSRSEAHQAIAALRTSTREGTLESRIEEMIGQISPGSRIRVGLQVLGDPWLVPHAQADHLFRVTQEATSNALQHAQASNIWINLHYGQEDLCLQITDDGRGFDPGTAPGPDAGHFGMTGMSERALRMGGSFKTQSSESGTKVTVAIARSREAELATSHAAKGLKGSRWKQ